jgi:hypothetical protein
VVGWSSIAYPIERHCNVNVTVGEFGLYGISARISTSLPRI